MIAASGIAASGNLAVERVRHPLKLRRVAVRAVERLTPHFVRVRFAGESLHDFVSASFDDHVKLMLPPGPGEPLVLPVLGERGPELPDGAPRPVMRDYTPRAFDPATGTLDIEFALHGDGPAAAWAAQAAPGQEAGVGGPRGSFVVPVGFDVHWLVGDDSALPAIARRLEALPATARAEVVVELAHEADRRPFESRAQVRVHWLARPASGSALPEAVAALPLPAGSAYAWAAGEAQAMAAVRRALVEGHGWPRTQVRAAAYWKRGAVAHHENLGD